MTPAEVAQQRAEEKAEFRQDHQRLAREREGCNTTDCYVARFDDPEREPLRI